MNILLALAACQGPVVLTPPEGTGDTATPSTSTDTDSGTPTGPQPCVPLESAFDANARPVIEARCFACHGETPEFGAPFSLDRYDSLVKGEPGERIVDRMVTALVAGDMPPATSPQLTHAELDTLVAWASCGEVHPKPGDELVVSQPVYAAPLDPPKGAEAIEITAQDESISPTTLDDYRTFTFRNLVTEDRFLQRIEPIVDESRVVHHITVRQSSSGRYLYTWAPGTDPIQLPGGIRITPSEELEVEIHYNNGAGIADVTDSSGMRLWLVDAVDTEYSMVDPHTWAILVPPGDTATATATCTAGNDFQVLAGMPHMHETGSTFRQVLRRKSGKVEVMIELTGWSFEAQYFYEQPFDIEAGDVITIECGYANPGSEWVHAGLGTSDEMCFDFLYVTPADAELDCGR